MDRKCSRCKATEGRFVRVSKSVSGREYFHCRRCNADRCREYRATPDGAKRAREAVYRSWDRNPERQAARLLLNAAVRKGAIVRPDRCSRCDRRCVVQAHHADYSRPLKVRWLCRQCHADLHRERDGV